jgi:hypothetical protein
MFAHGCVKHEEGGKEAKDEGIKVMKKGNHSIIKTDMEGRACGEDSGSNHDDHLARTNEWYRIWGGGRGVV